MDQSRFQQQPMTSGLTRYRSAPSSYFSSLLSNTPSSASGGGAGGGIISGGCGYARDDFSNLQNNRGSTSDIEQVFARFVASIGNQDPNSGNVVNNQQNQGNPICNMNVRPDFIVPKQEVKQPVRQPLVRHRSSDYSLVTQMNYESQMKRSKFVSPVKQEPGEALPQVQQQQQQQQQRCDQLIDNPMVASTTVDNSFSFTSSMNSARLPPVTIGGGVGTGAGAGAAGGNSNLSRYNSSPAGFFASFDIENDYGIRGIGSYGTGTSATTEASLLTPRSRKSQVGGFSSGKPPPSPGLMAPIPETGDKSLEESSTSNECKNDESCITDFPMPSWEDSHILSDDFLKSEDIDIEPFSNQNSEGLARPPLPLSHHLSLPASTMEKLLQDSVPLNVRAKRGCATHPRSIAERVRRTKISDRMRRLQELVPNMDKQTNTADMLDFAVDYIKELEKQVKILAERRAKCTCANK